MRSQALRTFMGVKEVGVKRIDSLCASGAANTIVANLAMGMTLEEIPPMYSHNWAYLAEALPEPFRTRLLTMNLIPAHTPDTFTCSLEAGTPISSLTTPSIKLTNIPTPEVTLCGYDLYYQPEDYGKWVEENYKKIHTVVIHQLSDLLHLCPSVFDKVVSTKKIKLVGGSYYAISYYEMKKVIDRILEIKKKSKKPYWSFSEIVDFRKTFSLRDAPGERRKPADHLDTRRIRKNLMSEMITKLIRHHRDCLSYDKWKPNGSVHEVSLLPTRDKILLTVEMYPDSLQKEYHKLLDHVYDTDTLVHNFSVDPQTSCITITYRGHVHQIRFAMKEIGELYPDSRFLLDEWEEASMRYTLI